MVFHRLTLSMMVAYPRSRSESQRRSLIPDDQQSEHLALFTKRDDALDQAFATASEQVGTTNVGGAQWFPKMHFSASGLWRRITSSIAAKFTKRDDTSRSNFSRSFGEKLRRDSRSPASKRTSAVSDLEDRSAEPQPANSQVVEDTLVTDLTGSNDSNATISNGSASTSSGNGFGRSAEALEKDYNIIGRSNDAAVARTERRIRRARRNSQTYTKLEVSPYTLFTSF